MVLVMFYTCLTRDTWIIMRAKKRREVLLKEVTAVHIIIFLSMRD